MLNKLNRIFAYAIWDYGKNELLVVRDQLGIKSLNYAETENSFVFSREINSLLCGRSKSWECRLHRVFALFTLSMVPSTNDILEGLKKTQTWLFYCC